MTPQVYKINLHILYTATWLRSEHDLQRENASFGVGGAGEDNCQTLAFWLSTSGFSVLPTPIRCSYIVKYKRFQSQLLNSRQFFITILFDNFAKFSWWNFNRNKLSDNKVLPFASLESTAPGSSIFFSLTKLLTGILFEFSPLAEEIWSKRSPGTSLVNFARRSRQNVLHCVYMA